MVAASREWRLGLFNLYRRVHFPIRACTSATDTFPGMWDVSVGGHFTAGDSSLETAVKETSEELGLDCDETSLRFVCTVATTATGSTPLHGDFLCNEYKVQLYSEPL